MTIGVAVSELLVTFLIILESDRAAEFLGTVNRVILIEDLSLRLWLLLVLPIAGELGGTVADGAR